MYKEQKAVDALEKCGDALADGVEGIAKLYAQRPPGAPEPRLTGHPVIDAALWTVCTIAVDNSDTATASYIYAKEKIKQGVYGEEYVIRLYKDTRKEAQRFIEKNGYDIAKEYFSDLESSIDKLKSAVKTSAQKAEIESMKGPIKSAAGAKLKRAEDAYREFVSDNKERFMSALSVSSAVVEELLEYSVRSKVQLSSKGKVLMKN